MSAVESVQLENNQVKAGTTEFPQKLRWLIIASVLGMFLGIYMALVYAGTDSTQGEVQRIFYFHLSAFFGAFFAFSTAAVAGVNYLRSREIRWDALALAGIEVGFVFSLINLVTGMVWAHPIWNTWWTWDPRLTSAAIMVLTYAAYLMLRNGIENPDQRRRFASIYGILALSTVFFTLLITRVRPDTIHPTVVGPSPQNAEGGFNVEGGMGIALGVNIVVWSVFLTPALIWIRIRMENAIEVVNKMKVELVN